jgi:hypothetical protein
MAANEWFTSSRDRTESRGRLDLARTASPGAIAAEILRRLELRAPLTTLALRHTEHVAWAESLHGGWCDFEHMLAGLPFPAAVADVTSCHPLVAHLVCWWGLCRAERVRRNNVTPALRRLCARSIDEPTTVLDPAVWRRFGFTLVEVVPEGEPFPIEVADTRRPDGRLEVVPVWSPQRNMYFAWPDVVAAAMRSGRVPRIVRAVRLVPVGVQPNLRDRLPLIPGVVLSANSDPALSIVRARQAAKLSGDVTLAAELHAVVNSLVFGVFWRFDQIRMKEGSGWVDGERPGPWNCLPIAATISAGARLLLATFDRLVTDSGGRVVYRDTDSSIAPASPNATTITLCNGSKIATLAWSDLDQIVEQFAPLSPEPEWPVWKIERGQPDALLHVLIFGAKRHVEFVHRADGNITIVESTEAQLGGTCVDPPNLRGRTKRGQRRWSVAAVEREIQFALARVDARDCTRTAATWDKSDELPFPEIRRFMVKTPEMANRLPARMGARPGMRYLEGIVNHDRRENSPTPVALDPGGDLSNWSELEWMTLDDGVPIGVTTDPLRIGSVLLETVDTKATRWASASRAEPIDGVIVEPMMIQKLGRVSSVLDADIDGLDDLAARRLVLEGIDSLAIVHAVAGRLGKRAFSRLTDLSPTVSERASRGEPISTRSLETAWRALRADAITP